MKLNQKSATPLYLQVCNFILSEIKNGKYKEGDKIPSEWELCKQFFEAFPEYDFPKRYDPYKRYRRIKDLPEFKAYKKKKLKHEFSQAMIILKL